MLVLTRDDTLRFVLWKAPGGLWTIRHMWRYSMETLSVYLSQTWGAPGQQVEPRPELGAPAPKPLNKPICSVSSEHTVVETLPEIPCAADTSSWRHSLREASVHHTTSVRVSVHWITLLNAPAYVSNRGGGHGETQPTASPASASMAALLVPPARCPRAARGHAPSRVILRQVPVPEVIVSHP